MLRFGRYPEGRSSLPGNLTFDPVAPVLAVYAERSPEGDQRKNRERADLSAAARGN